MRGRLPQLPPPELLLADLLVEWLRRLCLRASSGSGCGVAVAGVVTLLSAGRLNGLSVVLTSAWANVVLPSSTAIAIRTDAFM